MAYGIRLQVWGERALFTRPEMKVERVTYDVMTPSAARGILEAIHWKPAIRWVVDAIHVLRPIKLQSIRRNEVAGKAPVTTIRAAMRSGDLSTLRLQADADRQQRAATVLVDVDYVIEAHFEMTGRAGPDDNVAKHLDTFNRRARRGQCFAQPCFGTREFPARFELVEPGAPLPKPKVPPPEPEGPPLDRDLGFMLWDIDHDADRASLWFRAVVDQGVMRVPPPGSVEIRR